MPTASAAVWSTLGGPALVISCHTSRAGRPSSSSKIGPSARVTVISMPTGEVPWQTAVSMPKSPARATATAPPLNARS